MDDKPDSVVNGHSSTSAVASKLLHATRSHSSDKDVCRNKPRTACDCTRWGLPCHACHQARGALLPHLFTLACVTNVTIGGLTLCGTKPLPAIKGGWTLSTTVSYRVRTFLASLTKPATVYPRAYCTPSSTLRTWQKKNQPSSRGLPPSKQNS